MPTPRHPRHTAPHHAFTLTIPPAPPPQLLSILHPIATLHRLAILDRYIRTSPRPTSSPLCSTSIYAPRPDLLLHIVIPSSAPRSYLSILLPIPLPCTLRSPFCRKVCTPPPKASSNPPVEIFCPKRRRRLILNILPRRHRVDNSVSSSVHSEEKA